jgi:hypothetical protein
MTRAATAAKPFSAFLHPAGHRLGLLSCHFTALQLDQPPIFASDAMIRCQIFHLNRVQLVICDPFSDPVQENMVRNAIKTEIF